MPGKGDADAVRTPCGASRASSRTRPDQCPSDRDCTGHRARTVAHPRPRSSANRPRPIALDPGDEPAREDSVPRWAAPRRRRHSLGTAPDVRVHGRRRSPQICRARRHRVSVFATLSRLDGAYGPDSRKCRLPPPRASSRIRNPAVSETSGRSRPPRPIPGRGGLACPGSMMAQGNDRARAAHAAVSGPVGAP